MHPESHYGTPDFDNADGRLDNTAAFYDRESGALETVAQMHQAAEADDVDQEARAFAEGAPTPLMAGTFAIYEDGKGGYVLVAQRDGEAAPDRKHIPGALVKVLTGGLLGRKLGNLLG